MKKVTLYVGLNDKNTKRQEISLIEAYKVTSNLLARYVGGGTVYECNGIYTHDSGEIVIEKSFRIEIFNPSECGLNDLVTALKSALNQESIIQESALVTSQFI